MMIACKQVGNARIEIWDDYAAKPGTAEYERIAAEQQEAARQILANAARRETA